MRLDAKRKLRAQFGEATSEILQIWKKLDGYVRWEYTTVALNALAQHGAKHDAAIARQYLDSDQTDARLAAIKLLERFGDEADCNRLLEVAKGEWSTQKAAANAAIRLSAKSESVINSLLGSENLPVVEVALASLEAKDLPTFWPTLVGLLGSESEGTRMLAVGCLHRLAERSTLERLLTEYLGRGTYYYNVVCWLDRVLYAPASIQQVFVRRLNARQINSGGILDALDD